MDVWGVRLEREEIAGRKISVGCDVARRRMLNILIAFFTAVGVRCSDMVEKHDRGYRSAPKT